MTPDGLPHSEISGSKAVCAYPKLIAAYHVLHRFPEPRHSPCALNCLTSTSRFPQKKRAKQKSHMRINPPRQHRTLTASPRQACIHLYHNTRLSKIDRPQSTQHPRAREAQKPLSCILIRIRTHDSRLRTPQSRSLPPTSPLQSRWRIPGSNR